MNIINKSLIALDNLLNKISYAELDAIINEIDSIDAVGPTISQYFENFDSQFEPIFFNIPQVITHPVEYLKKIKYPQSKEEYKSSFDINFHKPLNCEISYNDDLQDNFDTVILIAA